MFYTSNFESNDLNLISSLIYPDLDPQSHIMPKNYTLTWPYRVVLSGIRTSDYENYFSNCFITPSLVFYSQINQNEAGEIISNLSLHSHDFYEIMFVLSGEVYVNIENERHVYQKGSCCILNKNVKHAEEYNTDFEIVFLQISTELMKQIYATLSLNFFDSEKDNGKSDMIDFLSKNVGNESDKKKSYVDFIPNCSDDDIVASIHNYFDAITKETMMPQFDSSIRVFQALQNIFVYLSTPGHFSTIPVQIGTTTENIIFDQIVSAMLETDGRISRSQLSEKLNYSGVYLNEICKKYTGKSLFDYGMTFCMKKAASLIADSNDNINDISIALGFNNRTHFYKVFKEQYGMTPAEYRRVNRDGSN